MNKEKLDILKEKFKDREALQVQYYAKILEEERQRFKLALTQEWLEDHQFTIDTTLISEKCIEWYQKAKTDLQREVLMDLIQASLRLKSAFNAKVTLSKSAMVALQTASKERDKAMRQNAEMKKTIEMLKKQIEYYERQD